MKRIYSYAIYARLEEGNYFLSQFRTLKTSRIMFQKLKDCLKDKEHTECILVARDYDNKIIKIYDRF